MFFSHRIENRHESPSFASGFRPNARPFRLTTPKKMEPTHQEPTLEEEFTAYRLILDKELPKPSTPPRRASPPPRRAPKSPDAKHHKKNESTSPPPPPPGRKSTSSRRRSSSKFYVPVEVVDAEEDRLEFVHALGYKSVVDLTKDSTKWIHFDDGGSPARKKSRAPDRSPPPIPRDVEFVASYETSSSSSDESERSTLYEGSAAAAENGERWLYLNKSSGEIVDAETSIIRRRKKSRGVSRFFKF